MKVKLILPVTLEGSEVQAGEFITLSDLSAKALIAEGRVVIDEEALSTEEKAALEAKEAAEAKEAELAKVKKALNDKYTRDDLAAKAKEIGVEFAYDAKKGDIVDAVIAADKAEALLV